MILDKLIALCYFLLFFLTPLLMYSKTSELFEFNKMLFIYWIALAVASLWIAKMISLKKLFFRRTPLDIVIIPFFLSLVISTILSIDRHTSFFGYYGRFNGGLLSTVAYLVLYYGFVSNIDLDRLNLLTNNLLLKISLIASLIVILWGLPGHFGYDMSCFVFTEKLRNNFGKSQFRPHERMFSTLGQPNWLGAYLAINFFIGLYFFIQKFLKKQNWLWFYIYLLLNFVGILFTRSRSALMALIVGIVLCFMYLSLKKQVNKKLILTTLILFILPIILFKTGISQVDKYLSLPRQVTSSVLKSTSSQTAIPNDSSVTESFDIRKIVWYGAIQLGFKYPLFGSGVETFAYAYNFVRPAAHNLTSEWDFIYNKAHNEYLNFLATTGFIGLISYLLLIIGYLFFVFRAIKKQQNLLIIFLTIGWITILITNFFGLSTTTVNIYFYLIPVVAFVITLDSQKEIIYKTLSSIQKTFLIVPVIIFILGTTYIVNYFLADISYAEGDNYFKIQQYSAAESKLDQALSMRSEPVYMDKLSSTIANKSLFDLSSGQTNDKKALQGQINNNYKKAVLFSQQAINSSSRNVYYWRTFSKVLFIFYQISPQVQIYDQAIKTLDTAINLAPTDAKLFYTKALFYMSSEDSDLNKVKNSNDNYEKALINIEKAIELKKDYRDVYLLKGTTLNRLGRKSEAKVVFQWMLEQFNPKDEEVLHELQSL